MNDIDAQIDDVIRSMPASLCQEVLQGMYPAGPPPVEESVFGTLPSSTHYLEPAPSAFYTPQGVPFGESHALSVPGGQLAFGTLPNVPSSAPYPSPSSIEGPMFGTIPNVPSNLSAKPLPAPQRDVLSPGLSTSPPAENLSPMEGRSETQMPTICGESTQSHAPSDTNSPVTFAVQTTQATKNSQADWRGRNPNRPVISPHSQGQHLTPAERSSREKAAAQRKLKQAELSDALQDLLAEQTATIDVIAQKHSVSATKVKKLLVVGTNYKSSRTPSLPDVLLHAKAQEVNASVLSFSLLWTNIHSTSNRPPHGH